MPKDLQQLQPPPADGDEPMGDDRGDEPAAPGAAPPRGRSPPERAGERSPNSASSGGSYGGLEGLTDLGGMGVPGDLGLTGFVPSAWTDDMDFMCEGLREDRTRRRSSSKSDDSDKSSGSGGRHAASRFKAHAADPRRGRSGSAPPRHRRDDAPRRRAPPEPRGPPRRDDLIAPLPAFATGYDAYALHAPPPPLRPAPEPAGFGSEWSPLTGGYAAPPPAEGAAPWYDADRQATSLPATAEEASDASGSGAPRPSEPAAQPQKKPSSRRRARPLAPPGVQLSADERTALERERNREHARNTRARKKEAIEKLKHDVEAWEVETRRTEERRAVKERKSERHERLLAEVFRARGEAVVDPEVWASWLAPGFELWQPQSDYVAHRPSDVVRERRVSRGVAGMADDVAAWAVFMHGVGRSGAFSSRMAEPPAYECRHIHADDKVDPSTFGMFGAGGAPPRRPPPPASSPRVRDDEVSTDDEDARERRVAYARDTIMGFWALRTLDAQRHGARCEVALRGMYCARFVGGGDATAENPIKLLRLELAYDMQSFARTVEAAASAPLPYAPNSLYDATFHDDPRAKVVTTARRPFVIANVNQAWLDLCGFGKDEVLGRTMSCIQGELTDKRAVESVHAAVAAGRAADMTLINYTSKGDAFLNYLRVFPLYADANPNQRPSNYLGILEDHAKRRHAKLDDGPTA